MGASATLVELENRLVALEKKLLVLGPPPQPERHASAKAKTIDAMCLKRPRECVESAPNKTLPLLAAQHRSRQIRRGGTPNPLVNNSLPASACSRPVFAWPGVGPFATYGERNSGKQDGGNLTAVIRLSVVLGSPIAK